MTNKKYNDLIEKYWAGETSLEEERFLFSDEDSVRELKPWSKFVNDSRVEMPSNLNDRILTEINNQKQSDRRFIIRLLATAATVALLVTGYLFSVNEAQMAYAEKEATLNEALAMFSQKDGYQNKPKVLYEDELVVIYQESE